MTQQQSAVDLAVRRRYQHHGCGVIAPHLRVAERYQHPALEHEERQHQHEPAPRRLTIFVSSREERGQDSPELEVDWRSSILPGGI